MPLFQNESYKKENEPVSGMTERVGGTNFHLNGSALRLVLTQRQKATQKVPIGQYYGLCACFVHL